jgi:menaquinone-dependent protoporphyrinogen oxidase
MTVLVSAASRHGSTAEIAEAIGRVLTGYGLPVDVRPVAEVTRVDGYDAVVLGSAVYAGHWLEPARRLAVDQARALAARPVWLFSSGPVGVPLKPDGDPVDVAAIVQVTRARGHQVFAGRLSRHALGFAEKAVVVAVRAPEGDYRNWAAVETWATEIAEALVHA